MSIQVVKCQTKVKTIIGDIKAIITGICIRDESITYELSYFHQGENKTCWVKRYEFEIDVQIRKPAGFVNYDKPEDENVHAKLLMS